MTHQTDHPDQHPQEDPMTTDPTATHHAQILDWLSAALTDESIHEIRLYQDTSSLSALGDWDVVVHKDVDPAKEAAAQSQADLDTLYRLDGAYKPPAWVADVLKNSPDPEPAMTDDQKRRFLPGFSGTSDPEEEEEEEPDVSGACQCRDCQDLEAQAAKSMTDYLKRRYGTTGVYHYNPDAYDRGGILGADDQSENTDGRPIRPISKEQWDAILASGVDWSMTSYGKEMAVAFTVADPSDDLLLALYGFLPDHDDEVGVCVHLTSPESIRAALDDLFRPEDDR